MGFSRDVRDKRVFMVGIKGTGMASLACVLVDAGAEISGSDSQETFFTETLLEDKHIVCHNSFSEDNLDDSTDMVIYSTAYDKNNPYLAEAERRHIPLYSYPQFLAEISKTSTCYGVAGTHGKTTASAAAYSMLKPTGLPVFAVFGAPLLHPPYRTYDGDSIGILESCEYQDHYLLYRMKGALVTTIDFDHPDYFADEGAVYDSFVTFCTRIESGGCVVICVDEDKGSSLAKLVTRERKDLTVITYGTTREADFCMYDYRYEAFEGYYKISSLDGTFISRLPGIPLTLDIVGAALLSASIVLLQDNLLTKENLSKLPICSAMLREGERFHGCKGRSEALKLNDGIVLVNDYAHHPTEMSVTIESLRLRYPYQRIIVVFAPHTVSRTKALFDQFAEVLSSVDIVFVRDVYASAREDGDRQSCRLLAESLARQAGAQHISDESELCQTVLSMLKPNDVCITMGAGNNKQLFHLLASKIRSGLR